MALVKIIRGAGWMLTGNFVYAASQWALIIVLAKLGTPEMLGQFTLALSIAAPVYMLTNMQLRAIQIADATERYTFSEYYGLRLIGVVVALLLIILMSLRLDEDVIIVVCIVGVMKGAEAISDIIYGALNARSRLAEIAKSLMLKGFSSVIVFALVMAIFDSITVGAFALAITWLMILITFDCKNIGYEKVLSIELEWSSLWSLIKVAYPLGLSVMMVSLQVNMPRYFLEKYCESASVGVFSALAYILVIGSVFINSIGQSISPQLAGFWASNDVEGFKRLTFRTVIIAGGAGLLSVILVFFLGEWFLLLFYGDAYAQWSNALLIIMLGGAFLYMASVFGYAMTAANIFKQQVPMFMIIVLCAFLASWLLIPRFGIIGAAWVSLIAAILQLAISYCIYQFRVR